MTIEGQIVGYNKQLTLHYALDNYFEEGNIATIKTDSLGRFKIQKKINKTAFFVMYFNSQGMTHTCRLIVQPGNYYSFISKGIDENEYKINYTPDIYSHQMINDNSVSYFKLDLGQMLFNLIDDGTRGALYHDSWDLMKPDSLMNTLRNRISDQLMKFQQLLKNGDITKDYFEIAKLNVEYTNAYRLAVTISDSWYLKRYKIDDTVIVKKLLAIYPSIFEMFPVNKEVKLQNHFCFDRYVDLYLEYLADCKTGHFIPQIRKGAEAVKPLLESEAYLNNQAYQVYNERKTMSYMASFGLNSADLGRKLLKEQPKIDNSTAFFINNVLIRNADEFNKLSDKKMPDNVIILDENDSINSFNQLCNIMTGNAFLIDIWGSWCPSCRYQFQFQDTLKPFLNRHGIKMVYIAFEYGNSREVWKNFIKGYKLEGYHFISNDKFKNDIKKHVGELQKVPTYIIVDKNGKVVETDAFFPSQSKELIGQLIKILNL